MKKSAILGGNWNVSDVLKFHIFYVLCQGEFKFNEKTELSLTVNDVLCKFTAFSHTDSGI